MKELITTAKDIAAIFSGFATFAAIIGVWIAWRGLKSWRDQLTGRTEYELARRLLRAVYRVRDGIRSVRNHGIVPAEVAVASAEAGIEHDNSRIDFSNEQICAVYNRRWQHLASVLSDLDVEALEAEVLWEQKAVERLRPLRQCVSKLRTNLYLYLRGLQNPTQRATAQRSEQIDKIIYEFSEDPNEDEFTAGVSA
jgi:hypothetical protein